MKHMLHASVAHLAIAAFANPAKVAAPAPAPIPVPPVAPVAPEAGATPPVVAPEVNAKVKADRIAPEVTAIATGITLPVRNTSRGNKTQYPFDTLVVGGMFGVKNKTKANLGSVITNQNRKYMEPKKDDAGNVIFKMENITDAAGTVVGQKATDQPAEMVATRHFIAIEVDADVKTAIAGTPLEGATVIVQRDA